MRRALFFRFYLAQMTVGKGRMLMSFGLDVLSDTCEGASLLDGMLDYVKSEAFVRQP